MGYALIDYQPNLFPDRHKVRISRIIDLLLHRTAIVLLRAKLGGVEYGNVSLRSSHSCLNIFSLYCILTFEHFFILHKPFCSLMCQSK